jgi:hypothetical protein
MKKYYKIFLILIVLLGVILLDWAALHDILKGNEDDYTNEYLILTSSIVVLGIVGYLFITGWVNNMKVKKG